MKLARYSTSSCHTHISVTCIVLKSAAGAQSLFMPLAPRVSAHGTRGCGLGPALEMFLSRPSKACLKSRCKAIPAAHLQARAWS